MFALSHIFFIVSCSLCLAFKFISDFTLYVTRDRRATPTSGARLWAWSRPGRRCGSGRRSGAAAGVRMASWLWPQTWTGSPPRRRSRACAEDGPRCRPSAPPGRRSGRGRRRLDAQGGGTETGLRDCLISTFHSKASTFYTKAHSIYVEQYVCELLWKTLPVASRDPKINFFSMKLCKYKYSMLEIKYY